VLPEQRRARYGAQSRCNNWRDAAPRR